MLKINGVDLPLSPSEFQVKIMDLDNSESSVRTADGTLTRDRIAVKRQIEMSFNGLLSTEQVSSVLSMMTAINFTFTYPDPFTGTILTKTFYVGDRPVPAAFFKDGVAWWKGFRITLTEI